MSRIINNYKRKVTRQGLRKKQTPQEIVLWARIRNNQTNYKWRRQVSIGPYFADFYCREKFLVVELDGSQHLDNKEYDKEREQYFLSLGIRTVRFWNKEVDVDIEGVIKAIVEKLEAPVYLSPLLSRRGPG